MAKYIVKPKQNIFDIALHLYGTIEGIFDLLITNKWLSMDSDLETGDELEYHEDFVINESVVSWLSDNNITPSNGERGVYYKTPDEDLVCVCNIDSSTPFVSFVVGGEGTMIADWGDNTQLEYIQLSHNNYTAEHYFNNTADSRRIRIYGDTTTMKLTYLNTTELCGSLLVTKPIVVDEYVSNENGFSLSGLFLFEGTHLVELKQCAIANLLPIADMDNLQTLDLTDVYFTDQSVLDNYLQHVASNYGTRCGCTVRLTTEPSETGWEAINTILGEEEWNTPTPWKFIINDKTYTYSA